MGKNMAAIKDSKTFIYWPKDIDENLKHITL